MSHVIRMVTVAVLRAASVEILPSENCNRGDLTGLRMQCRDRGLSCTHRSWVQSVPTPGATNKNSPGWP